MPEQTPQSRPYDQMMLKRFEQRLLEERRHALQNLGASAERLSLTSQAADGSLTHMHFHMADEGTDTMEREKAFLLASREGRLLWHIDEALRRLYRSPETFGQCEQCGGWIDPDRLDALPHARQCIACKQRAEAGTSREAGGAEAGA